MLRNLDLNRLHNESMLKESKLVTERDWMIATLLTLISTHPSLESKVKSIEDTQMEGVEKVDESVKR